MEPLLRVINLSKSFGTLPAIQGVSFEVAPGEVVGLAGRSGSGKSVLVMLLAGLYIPNSGDLYFADRRLEWPFQARSLGISVIHQKPELADHLDVTANIFLGNEIGWPRQGGWLKIPKRRQMEQEAARILASLDAPDLPLYQRVENLNSEERQIVAIARALVKPTRLVIVDEPTLLLSYAYQQRLLALIQDWRQQGTAVVFSSNNLDHLFAVTDRIVTLRQGRKIADLATDATRREEIVSLLIGSSDAEDLTPTLWNLEGYYRTRERAEKLRYHQMLLEKDLAAQDTFNRELISQLAEQVSLLDRTNLALQEAQRRLQTEREAERKHLARELHDQVIQSLLSVNFQLEGMADDGSDSQLQVELLEARETLRELVDDLRQICGSLRPPTLDSLGLGAAIQSYAHEWIERTNIALALDLDAHLGRLPEAIELSIFRIIQESLSNVRKHSQARQVEISLRRTSPRTLMLSIGDDGVGLPAGFDLASASAQHHFGLLGIGERVALMGGRLRIQNSSHGGLLLQVEIPHPRIEPVD